MLRLAVAGLVVTCLIAAPAALADGDPASDVLLTANVFLPTPAPSAGSAAALRQQTAAVYGKGFRVKVAVIASAVDLGSVPSLFGRPADYAQFLGTELGLLYVGPLLVVMPTGFGIYDGGRTTASEAGVLAGLKVSGTTPDDLAASAATAVLELLKAGALESKDILPPQLLLPAQAFGHPGKPLRLRYRVTDDSERSSVELRVTGAWGKIVARLGVPVRPAAFGATYSTVWRVPKRLAPGLFSLCATAVDPGGNRSAPKCAQLVVA